MDKRTIFVNSSGWLALYNKRDPNHAVAAQLWEHLRTQPVRFVITDYVLDQVYSALKVFGSLQTAQAVHDLVRNSQLVRFFMTDTVIFERAWRIFVEDNNPEWTFTDCVNFAVIQYLGISEVFTFDSNFTQAGLAIIPGK